MIARSPEIRGGRPCVAGTRVSVRRIDQWHNMGLIPEEIMRRFGHLSQGQRSPNPGHISNLVRHQYPDVAGSSVRLSGWGRQPRRERRGPGYISN
ncbi:MAG: DUF433 domain-containing protein [Acidobacteriia bacterium]|nr:DUF433 domain-containing protein [Terriglobia bacterium]